MSALAALRKLAGDSLIYGISGTISRFLSVFLVPIYTRLFSPAEYGVISLTTSFFALMNILILFGLDNSVARWYYDTEDKSDRAKSLNTFLWTCFTVAAFFGAIPFGADLVYQAAALNRLILALSELYGSPAGGPKERAIAGAAGAGAALSAELVRQGLVRVLRGALPNRSSARGVAGALVGAALGYGAALTVGHFASEQLRSSRWRLPLPLGR